jgi:hypothetical protein
LAWRDRTLTNLQMAMEKEIAEHPVRFARLELDGDEFTRWAYNTHVKAYDAAGFWKLPIQAIAAIAVTPDLGDVITPEGMEQIVKALATLSPLEVARIGIRSIAELRRRLHGIILQRWIS